MTAYQCDLARSKAEDKIDAGKTKSIIGYVGIGAGAALVATGVVLLLTGEDPNKYEHQRANHRALRWALLPGPGELGAAFGASF